MNIKKLIIIKELNSGGFGTVYLVLDSKSKNYYALKKEKILKRDIERYIDYENPTYPYNFSSSPLYRELDFAYNFANKHPQFFMQLKSWDIEENCDYKNPNQNWYKDVLAVHSDYKDMPHMIELALHKKKMDESSYCVRKVYSLVDGTIRDLLSSNTNKDVIRSLWIQFVYSVYLLDKEGYELSDTSESNVGFIKTNKKYIYLTIDNVRKRIPIFGYQLQHIDYGDSVNKNKADVSYNYDGKMLQSFGNWFHRDLVNEFEYEKEYLFLESISYSNSKAVLYLKYILNI